MELFKNIKLPKLKIEKPSESMVVSGLKKIEEENKKIFFILMMQSLLDINYGNLKINLLENQRGSFSPQLRKVETLLSSLSKSKLESFLQSLYPNIYLSYKAVESYLIQNVNSGANVSSKDIRLIFNGKEDDMEDWNATKKRTYSRPYSAEDAVNNEQENQQSQSRFKYLVDSSSPEISSPSTSRSSSSSSLFAGLSDIQLPIIHQPADLSDIKININSKSKDSSSKDEKQVGIMQNKPSTSKDIIVSSLKRRSSSLERLDNSGKVQNAISLIQQNQSALQSQEQENAHHKKKKKVNFVESDFTDLASINSSLEGSSSQDYAERFRDLLSFGGGDADLQDLTKEQQDLIKILLRNERFSTIVNSQSEDAILASNANSRGVFDLRMINDASSNKGPYDQEALKAGNMVSFHKFSDEWQKLLEKHKVNFANYDTKQFGNVGMLLEKSSKDGSSEKDLNLMAQEKYEFLRSALKEHLWSSCSEQQKGELLDSVRLQASNHKNGIIDLSQLEKMQLRYRFRKICTNQFYPKDLEMALIKLEVDGVEPHKIPRKAMIEAQEILRAFLDNINQKNFVLSGLGDDNEKLIEKAKSKLFQVQVGDELRQKISGYSDGDPNLASDKLQKFEELIEGKFGKQSLIDCKETAVDLYNRHQFNTARTEFLGSLAINHILKELGSFFYLQDFGNKGVVIDDGALLTSWLLNSSEKEVSEKLNKFQALSSVPIFNNKQMLANQMSLPLPVVLAMSELYSSYPDLLDFMKDNWKNYNLASFNKYQLMLNPQITNPQGWLEPNDIATTFISEVRNRTAPRNNYGKNCSNLGDISVSALNSVLVQAGKDLLDRDSGASSSDGLRVSACSRLVDLLLAKAGKADNLVFHLPSRR